MDTILIIAKQAAVKLKWLEVLKLNYQVHARDSLEQDQDFPHYDLLILDSDFLDHKQFSYARIKQCGTKVLMIGDQWPEAQQVNALSAGAVGYCDAITSTGNILKAVECIMQNDIWIKRHLFHLVIGALTREGIKDNDQEVNDTDEIESRLAQLSKREKDVAHLISKGIPNKSIAETLFISERTVKAHLTSIFTKLQVTNRLHLGLLLKDLE